MDAIKGKRVARLDSVPLDQTYFTEEGYLIDTPILTSCGIFEYHNKDGSIRRELRHPTYVFDSESLKSYKGKPIIITHDAGFVSTKNVSKEIVGTMISDGYKDGQDVRANIIIHDVEKVETCGMRELSLGYDLDLIEQPGEYNGEPYDAIQTNIRVNHLAIVTKARAGKKAHLNMDEDDTMSNDKSILIGGKKEMSKITHNDAALSPEDFAASIEAYKASKAEHQGAPAPSGAPAPAEPTKDASAEPAPVEPVAQAPKQNAEPVAPAQEKPVEDSAKEPAPAQPVDAMAVIGQLTESVQGIMATLEQLKATMDMAKGAEPMQEDGCGNEGCNKDGCNKDAVTEPAAQEPATEEGKEEPKPMNMDSVDVIVSQKLELAKIGAKLHLDGLETMDMMDAKKKVILTVRPTMNLDGATDAYIDAAFDISKGMVDERKDTNDQRRQMAKGQRLDGMGAEVTGPSCSASDARQRMIERRERKGGNE